MHPNNLTSAAIAEEFVCLDDPESGLSGVIVLNSTRLGPAAGGCRFWRYETAAEVAYDAMRLAEGMSYKNALADLTVSKLEPINKEMRRLLGDPGEIDNILRSGAQKARAIATPIMDEVKKRVGFIA